MRVSVNSSTTTTTASVLVFVCVSELSEAEVREQVEWLDDDELNSSVSLCCCWLNI